MNDIHVVVTDMPVSVKGQVLPTTEGDYLIFLNAHYNTEQQRQTFEHEVRHLLEGHHHIEGKNITEIELAASQKDALLDKIHLVEEQGLPLRFEAILPPAPLDDDLINDDEDDETNHERQLREYYQELLAPYPKLAPLALTARLQQLELAWRRRQDLHDQYRDHTAAINAFNPTTRA